MHVGFPRFWRRSSSLRDPILTPTDRELLRILHALPDDLRHSVTDVIRESGRLSALADDSNSPVDSSQSSAP